MINIGKAPYRISLLGGGSDLDWFVDEKGYGVSIGYSLDKFSYSIVNKLPPSSTKGIINYSSREEYSNINEIVHPLIRESLNQLDIKSLVEISTYGFASGGSGLGGSSSFLLSLLSALSNAFDLPETPHTLANHACNIEINRLSKPIGRQDQFLSAMGGISCLRFNFDRTTTIQQLPNTKINTINRIINNLYIIPTEKTRNADSILSGLRDDSSSIDKFIKIRNIAEQFIKLDEHRDHVIEESFHKAVKESWEIKKEMSNVMDSILYDQLNFINENIPNYWIRLLGAGSGGYFLVCIKDEPKLIEDAQPLFKNNIIRASLSNSGVSSTNY